MSIRKDQLASRLNRLTALSEIVDQKQQAQAVNDMSLLAKVEALLKAEDPLFSSTLDRFDQQLDLTLFNLQQLIQNTDSINIAFKKLTKDCKSSH